MATRTGPNTARPGTYVAPLGRSTEPRYFLRSGVGRFRCRDRGGEPRRPRGVPSALTDIAPAAPMYGRYSHWISRGSWARDVAGPQCGCSSSSASALPKLPTPTVTGLGHFCHNHWRGREHTGDDDDAAPSSQPGDPGLVPRHLRARGERGVPGNPVPVAATRCCRGQRWAPARETG